MVKKVLLALFLAFTGLFFLVNSEVLATKEGYVDCGVWNPVTQTCSNCSYNAATCADGCPGVSCDCGSNCPSCTPDWPDPLCDGLCGHLVDYTVGDGCGNVHWCDATGSCTTPPLTSPSCTIAGPSSVTTTDNPTYTITSSANANSTGVYKNSTSLPQYWPTVCESAGNCSGTTQFSSAGTYWVVCNAYSGTIGTSPKCSGNPWPLPSGWTDCGSSSRMQVTVTQPINGVCGATHYNCSAGALGWTAEYSDQWRWWCNGSNAAHPGSGSGVGDTLCAEMKPINGVCSATHYNCTVGTSASHNDSTPIWTWNCNGSNGGSNAPCTENKPACQVTTVPSSVTLNVGGTANVSASVTSGLVGATISRMNFGAYSTAIATVNPTSDTSSPYSTTVTAVAGGSTAVWGTATLSDGRTCQSTGSTDTDVNVAQCTVTLPATGIVTIGGTAVLTATTTVLNDTIASITFTSGTLSVATVSPASDTTSPYTTTVNGVSSGTSTITANGTMTGGGVCTPDTSIFTVPVCTVELNPHPGIIMVHGNKGTFTASLDKINASSVSFSSNHTDIVSVDPLSDSSPDDGYTTWATAVFPSPPTVLITASAIYNGAVKCWDTSNVTVNPRGPWWQVVDGDVQTNGNLYSDVPPNLYFGLPGLGGFPGVAKYGGSTTLTSGNVSVKGWLANSSYAPPNGFQNYSYFRRMIPEDVTLNPVSSFPSGGTASNGYYWYEYTGGASFRIMSPIDLAGRKVVLLVTGTDLSIESNIKYTPGNGIFVALVDGNINIDSSVGDAADPNFDLMGFFLADGNISTGISSKLLRLKGSVAALGGLNLQRNLGALNLTKASEVFEYDPASAFLFPSKLSIEKTRWKEVAP